MFPIRDAGDDSFLVIIALVIATRDCEAIRRCFLVLFKPKFAIADAIHGGVDEGALREGVGR